MHVAGIIAEYNPFHNGHLYQLQALRRQLGADTPVIAVMSGSFVQRGDCAMFPKHQRAALAAENGVDLVLELPFSWATASAERFAQGGVKLLAATGLVNTLVFGSESGNLDFLETAAEAIDSPAFAPCLREKLKSGCSFAAAREAAVSELLGKPMDLSAPNDLLGIEYLRAAKGTVLRPLLIRRQGAAHHGAGTETITSASDLRRRVLAGEETGRFLPYLPERLENPAALRFNERGLISLLRQKSAGDFLRLPHCGDGLERRLARAVREGRSLEEICALAKTRRFAHSRIRRLLLWCALGLTEADFPAEPACLRVLAANERGLALLHQMRRSAQLPLVVKPASARRMEEAVRRQLELEAKTTDLWQLCRQNVSHCQGGQEWVQSPIILKNRRA